MPITTNNEITNPIELRSEAHRRNIRQNAQLISSLGHYINIANYLAYIGGKLVYSLP